MMFHSISHLVLPMLNGASNPAGPQGRPLLLECHDSDHDSIMIVIVKFGISLSSLEINFVIFFRFDK